MKIIKPIKRPGFIIRTRGRTLQTSALIIATALAVWAMREGILAQVAQPVLKITPTNGTQFIIAITNAVASTNYEIYRTPFIGDANFPWTLYAVGSVGQSNFIADKGYDLTGFFRATTGSDLDGDGVPNGLDANSSDATIGILTITIDSPTNGMVIN